MQFQAKCKAFDLPSAVEEFVSERLAYEPGGKVLVTDMHTEFLRVHRDDTDSFSCTVAKFGKDVREAIRKRTGVWEYVTSRNTRVNGRAGRARIGPSLPIRGAVGVPPIERGTPSWSQARPRWMGPS